MNFRNALVELLETLNSNNSIEVQKDHIGVPVYKEIYETVTKHHQVTLSKKLFDFYHSMSSCRIEWSCDLNNNNNIKKYSPDDTTINGEIHIRSIGEMLDFDKKLEADWWISNLSDEERSDLYNFRYFDFNDDYIRVGFIINEKRILEEKLYFITQNSTGFIAADLSFDQYLEKIIEYKGFQGWQYNYFFQDSETYKRMMFYLERLF
jgi:hypothetical protein